MELLREAGWVLEGYSDVIRAARVDMTLYHKNGDR
jgi:hypothetical protein